MRIVVTSDSHRASSKLFEIIEKHIDTADLFIFLGDGEDDFDNALLLHPHIKYERVAGNCDWYSTLPLFKEITFDNKKIFFSHGHPFNVKFGYDDIIKEAKAREADICLFGHTHLQYTNYDDGLYIMNPGSVASNEYGIIDITPTGIAMLKEKI